ncbi:hypothetical protein CHLRE_26g756647v5 [Chlamydomonas reinhardtii]|uniref:Uncharacterized protein n=1 Tax=Chlamydomonas reinhardtii TaxID=3055 RepID=A0A2K3CN10_CHLRE|nr:uncharacterized protein CHLRE_26g756647v5 [Chlamydomonas reinhardtii]PNW69666.1 hypothetical protein CHLRE_26g756647v5 [Chlamydomonas reinhardtii]
MDMASAILFMGLFLSLGMAFSGAMLGLGIGHGLRKGGEGIGKGIADAGESIRQGLQRHARGILFAKPHDTPPPEPDFADPTPERPGCVCS